MGEGNKDVMAKNILFYLDHTGKTRKELSADLGVPYSTIVDWCAGNKYPRIDKIEMMANYFGIQKSDLIEDKPFKALPGYYNDERTAQIAERIYQDRYMGMVFDALDNSSPEEIKDFYDMLMLMKRRERRED